MFERATVAQLTYGKRVNLVIEYIAAKAYISNCRQIVSRYKKLAVTGRYTLDNVKIVWPTLTFAEICISNRY